MVWSYTFTNYASFSNNSNAITRRPNWPAKLQVNVPISINPPLNATNYNAMNFSQWRQLGRQVLIKSNINNWLVCHPGTGSLVDWQGGSVSCQIVERVTDTYKSVPAPSTFDPITKGLDRYFTSPVHGIAPITTLMVTRGTIGLPMILVEPTGRTT